jgi:hypothetical protein
LLLLLLLLMMMELVGRIFGGGGCVGCGQCTIRWNNLIMLSDGIHGW